MLKNLPTPEQDPILSLSIAYREDSRENKVDLGIGVYRNSDGETPIMKAVQQAQDQVVAEQKTKAYVGLAGCEVFNKSMVDLLLKGTSAYGRVSAVQTPGASGALRMLGDLMKVAQPDTTVWISNPSYVNHKPVMEASGLKVRYYNYFCPVTKLVDGEKMLADLSQAGPTDVVILHGCCHNPTGADLSFEHWKAITELALKNGFLPFVDIAYQGFGDGLEQDAAGMRYMADHVGEMFIATSCSKNFGLYRERTGAAIVIGQDHNHAQNAKGKLLQLARTTYTMPPDHGAALVGRILTTPDLTATWKSELVEMQSRLVSLRTQLTAALQQHTDSNTFDFINHHKGMFTVTGLSSVQMAALGTDYGIYAVGDGRINIAGLQEQKIDYVAQAIASVSRT